MKLRIRETEFPIKEKMEVGDYGVVVTDYVGDVVNLLLHKPKIYRLCYDPNNDIYMLGSGMDLVHATLCTSAEKLGYDCDPHESVDFIFCPYKYANNPKLWGVEGFGDERTYKTPIKSGYILTYDKYTIESKLSDLYRKLKSTGSIIPDPYPNEELLYPEYNESNDELYARLCIDSWSFGGGHKKTLLGGTVPKQIEMLKNLGAVVDPDKLRYMTVLTNEELQELEQQLWNRWDELYS